VKNGWQRLARRLRSAAATLARLTPGTSVRWGPPRHSVADTPAWWTHASAGGAGGWRLTAARATQRIAPRHADAAIASRFAAMRAGTVKARFVAELPEARVWGLGFGAVIDRSDALHHDLSPAWTDYVGGRHEALQRTRLPASQAMSGTAAVLGAPFCANFHHWLLDALPKFGLLREAGWALGAVDHVVLPPGTDRRWHRETLELLGVEPARVRRLGRADQVRFDRVLAPSYSEPGREPERYDYTPEGLRFVRELVLPRTMGLAGCGARVVVSREKAAARRLLDGEAIHARLARNGFRKVLLEEMSLTEQAACFARAEVVVFPTGGNLANLVFCRPGTRVVELFSPAYLPTFCLPLTQALGLEYHALVGEATDGRAVHSDEGGCCDICVSAERILEHAG
jgi:capsular polysaccharide biosynthesis protein